MGVSVPSAWGRYSWKKRLQGEMGHSGVMTGAHLHGVGALPGPAPALKAYDPMFARHGVLEPRIPTHGIRNPPTRRARSSVPRPTC